MKKVLFVTNIPSPYRVDFFNEFGSQSGVALDVLFLETPGEHNQRSFSWFNENYKFFNAIL